MVILNDNRSQNLLSYKYFIRPTAHKLYGKSESGTKHQQNVQKILRLLALNGPMTTWDLAKVKPVTDSMQIRTREKEYRRLLIGRTDRGNKSPGIIDLNLVLVDSISTKRNPGNKYRLSIFGIFYCLDVLNFNENDVDKLAENYSVIIPFIFGKWHFLKSLIGSNVYNLSLLGKGLLFDNPNLVRISNPKFYELISYFGIKSNRLSGSLTEKSLGELVSLWFYITLLYLPFLVEKQKNKNHDKYLKKVLQKDFELKTWFDGFIKEAQRFYAERTRILEGISISY